MESFNTKSLLKENIENKNTNTLKKTKKNLTLSKNKNPQKDKKPQLKKKSSTKNREHNIIIDISRHPIKQKKNIKNKNFIS
jgi:hypothetical protein